MHPDELTMRCLMSIERTPESPDVTLVMPGRFGKRTRKRLCPGGPYGEIVSDNFNGPGCIVIFDAHEVLAFLKKQPAPTVG